MSPNRKSQIESIRKKVKIGATEVTEQNETVGSQRKLFKMTLKTETAEGVEESIEQKL